MFHLSQRFLRSGAIMAWLLPAFALLLAVPGWAAAQFSEKDFAPGFGLIYGEGRTQEGASSKRFGFSSRRLKDKDRTGSLAIVYEEHTDGLPFDLIDNSLSEDDVKLRYRSLFAEMKRYFPLGGSFNIFWGLRGGFTRIDGTVDPGGGQPERKLESDQVAPLWMLAIPLALEHPGFLLLAFIDGAALGLSLDLVPERMWLEYQIGAALIPNHRDEFVAVDDLTLVTQTLQLVLVF